MSGRIAYNGDFGTACLLCSEGKLSCPKAKANSEKSVLVRVRLCRSCGAEVRDTVVKKREVVAAGTYRREATA